MTELTLTPVTPGSLSLSASSAGSASLTGPREVGDIPVWDGSGYDFLNYWFDVRSYGAVGDGSTDDSSAFYQALQAAAVAGGTVYVPAGTFRVSQQYLTGNGIAVRGAGVGATTVKLKDGLSADNVFSGTSVSDCLVADMTINCNRQNYLGATGAVAVFFTLGSRNTIRNVRVTNAFEQGIAIAGATYTTITDVVVDNTVATLGHKDIWIGKSGSTHSTGTTVDSCRLLSSGVTIVSDDVSVNSITATCPVAEDGPFYVGEDFYRVKVANSYFYSAGNYGIDFDFADADETYGCVISGNTCVGNHNSGIGCASNGALIVGNNCYNNGQSAGTYPYGILIDGAGIVVVGNTCSDNQGSPTQTYGVGIRNLSTITASCVVANNNLANNATGAITGQSNGSNHQIGGNVGSVVEMPGSREQILRDGQAIKGEAYPRTTGSAGTQLTGGTIYLVAVGLKKGDVVTNVLCKTTAGGTTTTLSKVGLYDKNGNRLAISADRGSDWDFVGAFTNPLTGAYTVTSTDLYYLAVVTNATSTCSMWGTTTTDLQAFSGGVRTFATGGTGQTDLPSTVTPAGTNVVCYWLGWS